METSSILRSFLGIYLLQKERYGYWGRSIEGIALRLAEGAEEAKRCKRMAYRLYFYLLDSYYVLLVARAGIEPATRGFSVLCSTD